MFSCSGEVPPDFVWADDARAHVFMRHSDPQNFGHLMVDDFLSAYSAGSHPSNSGGGTSSRVPQLDRFSLMSPSLTSGLFYSNGAAAAARTLMWGLARATKRAGAGCKG